MERGGGKDQPVRAISMWQWEIGRGQQGCNFPGSTNFGEGLTVKGKQDVKSMKCDSVLC